MNCPSGPSASWNPTFGGNAPFASVDMGPSPGKRLRTSVALVPCLLRTHDNARVVRIHPRHLVPSFTAPASRATFLFGGAITVPILVASMCNAPGQGVPRGSACLLPLFLDQHQSTGFTRCALQLSARPAIRLGDMPPDGSAHSVNRRPRRWIRTPSLIPVRMHAFPKALSSIARTRAQRICAPNAFPHQRAPKMETCASQTTPSSRASHVHL
ncbi:hypothetical protein DFH09DRAFT_1362365 [Mycena vulgaris]|nr:hypothetical protein DFH09DRAFT_1362365 [Mycena vulgaris]